MKSSEYKRLMIVLIIALLARLISAFPVLLHPERGFVPGDSERYHRLGINIAHHGVFSIDRTSPFRPYFLRPPVYPAFIALLYRLFGVRPQAVIVAQIMLSMLTVLLIFHIGHYLWNERAGLLASAFYGLSALPIAHSILIMSETLFTFLLTFALFLFLKATEYNNNCTAQQRSIIRLMTSGMILGISALCRSIALLLSPLLAGVWAIYVRMAYRRKILNASALILSTLVLVVPWIVRNRVEGGIWTPDINGQVTLVFAASVILSHETGLSTSDTDRMLLQRAVQRFGWERTYAEKWHNLHIICEQDPRKATQLMQVALEIIRSHPISYLRYHLTGCLWMFTPYVSYSTWVGTFYGAIPKSETPGGLGKTTAHLIATGRIVDAVTLITRERFAPYPLITVFWVVSALWELAIYVFALRGWYLTRGQFPWWHISTCVILYFAVLSGLAGHFAISRLRMPIEPLLCLLAGYGTMK